MNGDRYYHYYRPGKPGWSRRWANVRATVADLAGLVWLLFCLAFVLYGTTRP